MIAGFDPVFGVIVSYMIALSEKSREIVKWAAPVLLFLFIWICSPLQAQTVDDCMDCHEDPDLTREIGGREVSLQIDLDRFNRSVHVDLECVGCHEDLDGFDDFPHEDNLTEVACDNCHDDIAERYAMSLHGQEVARGAPLAPKCWDCHGAHDIMPPDSPEARVAKHKIPIMCGRCHKEGTSVTKTYDIPQDSILSHYSLSIHGYGLFQQGLTVTAVCSDCHTAHFVLPHDDPRSSINRANIANTCQQCHGRIKEVHQKVIKGELWESEPHKVPVCVDCHEPHKVRKVFYGEVSDSDCLKCHADPDLKMLRDGIEISLTVDSLETHSSAHQSTRCAQCHTGVSPGEKRPCRTVADRVDCSICHSEIVDIYATSTHGRLSDRGDDQAPICTDCHGRHGTRYKNDKLSPTFPTNVPALCGECHQHGGVAARRQEARGKDAHTEAYAMSIHGKGLLESGLVVTAMCTDCHTAHHVLPASDILSSVNRDNISETCAVCHNGIYEKFKNSIHAKADTFEGHVPPSCADCHKSHTISRTDSEGFQLHIMDQCGRCHEEVMETYFETYHGKVSKLGFTGAAKCYDCHGSHEILPPSNPNSTLSRNNIVETCAQCHPSSHRQFAGYLTHATHHDRDKYPILYWTFWAMTTLLVGTLIVATLHTLLWLPRSWQTMKQHKKLRQKFKGRLEYRRFKRLNSILHAVMVISFLGLAITGMILKFSYLGWAYWLARVLGGFEIAGFIHRICAVMTFGYFITHIYDMIHTMIKKRSTIREHFFGPNSMMPNMTDLKELIGTLKWFLGKGPRPRYGRWTYWEKFDYFAVFWGVGIIGLTGLLLWFPEWFTLWLPGWIINVATIIHSDEALLATAFIFTVHFFNTHFRPDRFPMDTVIFTGRIPIEELKIDRPREYEEMVRSKELKKRLCEPLPEVVVKGLKVFGAMALITGLILIFLIIYAEVFGYR